jgi:uncharacterized protein YidB (DUF937 family)
MGLLDVLTGMQNGPRGQRQPQPRDSGGGLSPMMMVLLALLAYKALKGSRNRPQAPAGTGGGGPVSMPPGTTTAGAPGGGLGDILGGLLGGRAGGTGSGSGWSDLVKGGLGGLLGGAAAGSVLSGGLGNLVKDLQERGLGNATQSWVGSGPNQEIAPRDLEHALGGDTLDALAQQTGIGRDELLNGLSQHLPDLIDQLTPHGRLPTEQEAARMV